MNINEKMKNTIVALMLIINSLASAQKVEWVSSTEKYPWVKEKSLTMNKVSGKQGVVIEIYPEKTLQKMTGFGGCFNEFG